MAFSRITLFWICTTYWRVTYSREQIFARGLSRRSSVHRYTQARAKQQAATERIRKHSPRTILQGSVIKEDSIFPSHASSASGIAMVTASVSCGLLCSFFMFSLFDVVPLGGLLIQSSSARARAVSLSLFRNIALATRYHFTNFPFILPDRADDARNAERRRRILPT